MKRDEIKNIYVGSETDEPTKIFFTPEEAFQSGLEYMDVFNSDGDKVDSYKIMDWSLDIMESMGPDEYKFSIMDYTEDF